jgi:cell division protein FtsW
VLLVGYVYILKTPFRIQRITAFLDPESDPKKTGYQILQSLYAVGSGGVSGVGLGSSKQKLGFLPEARTDFIFAVVAEELGFIGTVTIVLVFGLLMWRCLKASFRAPDQFGQLLGIGLTTMLIAQAFFNMSVVLSLVPTKGITLPFVSAGGSSLVFALAAVGILLNISEQARAE